MTNILSQIRNNLFSLASIAVLLYGFLYGTGVILQRIDAKNAEKWAQLLEEVKHQNESLRKQLEESEKRWAEQNARQRELISELTKTIEERNARTEEEIKKNASLTAQEAAEKLSVQINAGPEDITVQDETIVLSLPVTRRIITALDLLETARLNLIDVGKQLEAQTIISNNLQEQTEKQKQLISEMERQIEIQKQACIGEVAALKAESRKSKLKWFGIGFLAGLVARTVAGL